MISEVTFAGDDGTPASDTLIAEVLKEAADECGRRPLRLFQKTESVVEDKPVASKNSRKGAAAEAATGIVQPTVSKEPVVEIMTRERFYSAVKLVNPYFTLFEAQYNSIRIIANTVLNKTFSFAPDGLDVRRSA